MKGFFIKIALFGGSFDPIHRGHIEIVQKVAKELRVDKIVVMPTFLSPFKEGYFLEPKRRWALVKRCFLYDKRVVVSDFEVRQHRAVATYESVLYLQKRFRPTQIYCIIGADNVAHLHRWQKFSHLRPKVKFVIATRGTNTVSPKSIKQ